MSRMFAANFEKLKKDFDLTDEEMNLMDEFMAKNNGRATKDILDTLISDKTLDNKQLVILSYITGCISTVIKMERLPIDNITNTMENKDSAS